MRCRVKVVMWTVAALVVVFLVALLVALLVRGPSPRDMVRQLKTGTVDYARKVRWFEKLSCVTDDPEVKDFFVGVVEDPFICFHPGYRRMAANETYPEAYATSLVTRFRIMAIEALPKEPEERIITVLVPALGMDYKCNYTVVWRRWLLITYQGIASTRPVREYALEKLQAITGMDHGYDQAKWRGALQRKYGFELPPAESSAEE